MWRRLLRLRYQDPKAKRLILIYAIIIWSLTIIYLYAI